MDAFKSISNKLMNEGGRVFSSQGRHLVRPCFHSPEFIYTFISIQKPDSAEPLTQRLSPLKLFCQEHLEKHPGRKIPMLH
jgi:hypothetical protein